jgi:hypothetical protein
MFLSIMVMCYLTLAPSAQSADSLGGITLTSVAPHIMTPNNDGYNDRIFFNFDSPLAGLPIDGGIFDINGAKIASMHQNDDTPYALTWNGTDDSGNPARSGIYIYQIKLGTHQASGTFVVSR